MFCGIRCCLGTKMEEKQKGKILTRILRFGEQSWSQETKGCYLCIKSSWDRPLSPCFIGKETGELMGCLGHLYLSVILKGSANSWPGRLTVGPCHRLLLCKSKQEVCVVCTHRFKKSLQVCDFKQCPQLSRQGPYQGSLTACHGSPKSSKRWYP